MALPLACCLGFVESLRRLSVARQAALGFQRVSDEKHTRAMDSERRSIAVDARHAQPQMKRGSRPVDADPYPRYLPPPSQRSYRLFAGDVPLRRSLHHGNVVYLKPLQATA
jgi:hypothetical protein